MRLTKTATTVTAGLSAVAAALALAACSPGSSASGGSPTLATNAATSSRPATQSSSAAPTTPAPTTTAPRPTTTTPPPATTKAPTRATETVDTSVPCRISTGACVDLSAHEAWLLRDGQVVYGPVHALGGRRGWPTAVGTFHVTFKSAHFYSTEFHAPMPYSVFFYRGDALHAGSAYTPSHGCVHLSLDAAETFYENLAVGDPVQVVS